MAPRTRLQAAPERRVRYNGDSEATNRKTATLTLAQPVAQDRISKARGRSRIPRQNAPEPETSAQVPTFAEWATARETPEQTLRAPAPRAVPRGIRGSRNQAVAPLPSTTDKKAKANMKLCAICYHEKGERSFRPPKDITLCQHFADTCRSCIERTVRSLVDRVYLNDGDLKCWHYECTMVIPYVNIKNMISPGLFDLWDKALLKRQIDSDPNVIACLSSTCGQWFSIEGWLDACKRAKKISCPYCKFEQCIACTRPWHKGMMACPKDDEDKISDGDKKRLGIQPCPSCGVKIKKEGGCNHIRCMKCSLQFCWLCLETTPTHTENCAEHRGMPMPPLNALRNRINGLLGLLDRQDDQVHGIQRADNNLQVHREGARNYIADQLPVRNHLGPQFADFEDNMEDVARTERILPEFGDELSQMHRRQQELDQQRRQMREQLRGIQQDFDHTQQETLNLLRGRAQRVEMAAQPRGERGGIELNAIITEGLVPLDRWMDLRPPPVFERLGAVQRMRDNTFG